MTYKHYLLKNQLTDSKESYTAYCDKYGHIYRMQPEGAKKQYIDCNYKRRFINS